MNPAQASYPAKGLRWMIAISVSLAALMEVIDSSIVNVALTDMQATLGATLSEIGWVVTGYGVANVIMIPLSAWLGDVFGKKRYFVFAMVGFTAASILCGVAPSLPFLVGARILQGLMGGGLLAKAQAFLFETFPKEEQGAAQALFGACVIAGPAIGPTLGGWLTTNYTWPWIFFVNLPVGIGATIMCLTFLPKDKAAPPARKVDYFGIATLIVWVGSFQTFLEQGNEDDWFQSSFIVALAVASVVGFVAWIWRELTFEAPAVNLKVLRHRSLSAGSAYSFVVGVALYGALFAVPIFCQQVLGFSPLDTGLLMAPGALASALMMPIIGRLGGRIDSRFLIVVGSAILITALSELSQISPATGAVDLQWPLIIRGAGTTLIFLPLSLATFGPIPRGEVSAATGFYNLTRQLGGSVGVAFLTTLLDRRESFHRAVLVENVGAGDPLVLQRLQAFTQGFIAKGMDPATAHNNALAALDRLVSVQSAVISFGDTFKFVAWLTMASVALLAFLGSGKGAKGGGDLH